MIKRSVVRRYGQFYEATGEFAVPKQLAYETTDAAMRRISQFVGPVTLLPQKGLRLKSDARTIRADKLSVPRGERYNIILTGRRITDKVSAEQGLGTLGLCVTDQTWPNTSADVIVSTDSRMGPAVTPDYLKGVLQHEIAHSFGLGHCIGRGCIMLASSEAYRMEHFAHTADPFCDEHAEQLELNGYKALAETL